MDLIERYLGAIRHNLPVSRADDITNELREELYDRIEAREAQNGRPIEAGEVSDIVRDYGPPLLVASRYREHQYLIGPGSYPFYLYGLRVVFVIALMILLFTGIVPAFADGDAALEHFFSGVERAYYALIFGFAWCTIVIAAGERIGLRGKRLATWDPQSLPAVAQAQPRGKWASPIQVGLCVILLLAWAGFIPIPIPVGQDGQGVRVTAAPMWSAYYWPVLVLGGATLLYNLICWLRPGWDKARLALSLGTQIGWVGVVASLKADGPWFLATSASAEYAERAVRAQAGVNSIMAIVLIVMLIALGIGLVMALYQNVLRRFFVGG